MISSLTKEYAAAENCLSFNPPWSTLIFPHTGIASQALIASFTPASAKIGSWGGNIAIGQGRSRWKDIPRLVRKCVKGGIRDGGVVSSPFFIRGSMAQFSPISSLYVQPALISFICQIPHPLPVVIRGFPLRYRTTLHYTRGLVLNSIVSSLKAKRDMISWQAANGGAGGYEPYFLRPQSHR